MQQLDPVHELELATRAIEVRDRAGAVPALRAMATSLAGLLPAATSEQVARLVDQSLPLWIRLQEGSDPARVSTLLGLELEGLSAEDRELEVTRELVRSAWDRFATLTDGPEGRNGVMAAYGYEGSFGPGEVYAEFGEGEQYGEYGEGEFGQGEFGQGEQYGETEYGQGEYNEFGQGEQYGESEQYGEFGEGEYNEFGEGEQYGEAEFGELQEAMPGELEQFEAELQELNGEYSSPLGEQQEMELAAQLLEIRDEAELEQFLGGLIKNVAKGVGGFLDSPTGKALGGILKNVAKKALPMVGGAIGSFVAPGIGTAIGTRLGSMATKLFEAEVGELEALSQDEAEFEVARRYVRFSAAATRNAALSPRHGQPQRTARAAAYGAARRHAGGVARRYPSFARPGQWHGSQQQRRRRHHHPQQPGPYPYAAWPYPVPPFPPPYPVPQQEPPQQEPPGGAAPNGAAPKPAGGPPPDAPPPDAPPDSGGQSEYGYHGSSSRQGSGGRWVRRGSQIVLYGA
ncbi:hypothetical protein ACIBG5_05565 [Kribbella sp. NPDC050241]|uniref:hypothetical protein n=1 Tax=Kribbella sp. NPDC050241 TaxID=3364115 RepID=UPI0037B2F8C2